MVLFYLVEEALLVGIRMHITVQHLQCLVARRNTIKENTEKAYKGVGG